MSTSFQRRTEDLQKKIKARCKSDGSPRPGYEQSVAQIRAELEIISGRIELAQRAAEDDDDGR